VMGSVRHPLNTSDFRRYAYRRSFKGQVMGRMPAAIPQRIKQAAEFGR